MPVILFKLNGVPDDEAADVRDILDRHAIEYYETSSGNWGVSLAAIWLKDDSLFLQARELIDEYQAQRKINVREEFKQLKDSGKAETMLTRILGNPVQLILYLLAIGVLLYFSIKPFFSWTNSTI